MSEEMLVAAQKPWNRGKLNQGRGVARSQFSYYNNRWMSEKYKREKKLFKSSPKEGHP
jgi:hypothetical protein